MMSLASLALAPGLLQHSLHAPLAGITPTLQTAIVDMAPPHFHVAHDLPKPASWGADFKKSALSPSESGEDQTVVSITESEAPHQQGNDYYGPHSIFASPVGFDTRSGGGFASRTVSTDIASSSEAATVAVVKQTFTPHGDKPEDVGGNDINSEPEPTPPGTADNGQTALASKDAPPPNDLHNPVGDLIAPEANAKPHRPEASVPEPSALLLLCTGVVGLVLCRRQKI